MKKTIILAICLLTVGAGVALAQQKVGHVNANEILIALPEFKTASDSAQNLEFFYQNELKELQGDFQKRATDFQESQGSMSEAMRKIKYESLVEEEQKLQLYAQEVQKELTNKKQLLMKPLEEKLMGAIDAVAKANKYTYIIDASLLIYADGDNIASLVFEHLNITPPAETSLQNGEK